MRVETCLSRRTIVALKGTKPEEAPVLSTGVGICERPWRRTKLGRGWWMPGIIQVSGGGCNGLEGVETPV